MRFYLITVGSEDKTQICVDETFLYRGDESCDFVEMTKRFGQFFRTLKRDKKYLNWFEIKTLGQLPFFINERAVPLHNFWPMSFPGSTVEISRGGYSREPAYVATGGN